MATAAPAQALPQRAFTAADTRAAQRAKASGMVSVDVLDTNAAGAHQTSLTVAPRDTVHVVGWAYHESLNAPCANVGLLVDGKRAYPAAYGYARPDVAAFYKDRARTNVGYSIAVPAATIGNGTHSATVVCLAPNGPATSSSGTLQIIVR